MDELCACAIMVEMEVTMVVVGEIVLDFVFEVLI